MLVSMSASSYNVGGAFQVSISQSFGSKQINLNGANIGTTSPTGEYLYQGNFDAGDVGQQTWFFAVSDGFGHNDTGMVSFNVSGSPVTAAPLLAVTSPSTYVYTGATTPTGASAQLVSNPINPGTPMVAVTPTGTYSVGTPAQALPTNTVQNTTNQTTNSGSVQQQGISTPLSTNSVNTTNGLILPGPPSINPQINTTNTTGATTGNTTDTSTTGVANTNSDLFSATVSIGGMDVPVWEVAVVAIVGLMMIK